LTRTQEKIDEYLLPLSGKDWTCWGH